MSQTTSGPAKGPSIQVSLKSELPIYRQIEDQLRAALLSGTLEAGAELPSIRKLAAELQVSVITTKRAYEELEKEGYIVSLPGRGCFVAERPREDLAAQRRADLEVRLLPLLQEAASLGLGISELGDLLERAKKE